jgi:hypothetical protein
VRRRHPVPSAPAGHHDRAPGGPNSSAAGRASPCSEAALLRQPGPRGGPPNADAARTPTADRRGRTLAEAGATERPVWLLRRARRRPRRLRRGRCALEARPLEQGPQRRAPPGTPPPAAADRRSADTPRRRGRTPGAAAPLTTAMLKRAFALLGSCSIARSKHSRASSGRPAP